MFTYLNNLCEKHYNLSVPKTSEIIDGKCVVVIDNMLNTCKSNVCVLHSQLCHKHNCKLNANSELTSINLINQTSWCSYKRHSYYSPNVSNSTLCDPCKFFKRKQ